MDDLALLYDGTRVRIADLVTDANAEQPVPCCPAWRVRDVVSHLTGLAQAWVDGQLDGYASAAWTQAQVDARTEVPLGQIFDEWGRHTGRLLPMLRDPGAHGLPTFMAGITLGDLVTHEHDIRGAIGQPGARDSDAVAVSLRGNLRRMDRKLEKAGLSGLRIETEAGVTDVGTVDSVASLRISSFELWRSFSGRRSRDQVQHWDWSGDADGVMAQWLEWPFEWPAGDIVEPA